MSVALEVTEPMLADVMLLLIAVKKVLCTPCCFSHSVGEELKMPEIVQLKPNKWIQTCEFRDENAE